MKHGKMLGLAAVAAAALMAFVGASTAPATVLCKTAPITEGKCAAGWAYSGEIHAVSTVRPLITNSFKTVECAEWTVADVVESEGDATHTVTGSISALTVAGCNCTFAVVQKGTFEVHAIGNTGNGTFTSNGMTMTTSCSTIFGTVHCNYVTENDDLGTLTGGATATMTITVETKRELTSGICDEEAVWHAAYKFTSPDSLYVATST